MSESQQQLSSEATDEPKTLAETALGSFDMSVGSVPEDWVQAEEAVSYTHLTLPTIYSV